MRGLVAWGAHKRYRLGLRLRGFLLGRYIRFHGGKCGKGLLVDSGFFLKNAPHSGISIGDNVSFGKNVTLDVLPGGRLDIRSNVSFTMNVFVAAAELVTIDEQTMVAEFTSIRDADHSIEHGKLIRYQPLATSPIAIGKDVWIGRGVAVLKGAIIGDGAVIGANSVVRGEVAPHAIAVGVPARVVKYRYE